jgi:hypothetical protein
MVGVLLAATIHSASRRFIAVVAMKVPWVRTAVLHYFARGRLRHALLLV